MSYFFKVKFYLFPFLLTIKVTSLEAVVSSLKQENTLLARGINKMVAAVQEEKAKNTEVLFLFKDNLYKVVITVFIYVVTLRLNG